MRLTTRELCYAALLLAVMCVLSLITIPIPISPVPLTLGMAGLHIVSMMQRPGCTAFTLCAYLLMGLIGLPVFSGFRAGLQALAGPTGGYLLAYLPAGVLASAMQQKAILAAGPKRYMICCAAMLCTMAICYTFGSAWLAISNQVSFGAALRLGALPFIPLDLFKIAVCVPLIRVAPKLATA